ncbi:hypothetical protein RHMOL_Rhmol03G0224100 [Rhododendron molle]|uniref:Uncharacterized protein n=1 Tax=Rhododendron molle TaxID=49168 RepID=A0ACC0PGX4_RHOML|nr:hypothetical protein RHMOL_Rhmol03G0224100 [Rhododendron molle]
MEVTRASMVAVAMLALVFAVFLPSALAHSAAPAPAPTSDGTSLSPTHFFNFTYLFGSLIPPGAA